MDKRMLQTYSVWSKENLEKQIEVSLKTLGINSDTDIKRARRVGDFTVIEGDAKSYPYEMYEQRQFIADLVKSNGYKSFIEEIAYTWFNRLVALRFMEVHDFLPHGFRVLSSRSGDVEPEILKNLGFVKSELGLNMDLVGKLRDAGNIEGLFRYVLLRQCAALADILPMLFSRERDYLSLLLPQTLLTGDTVLTRLLAIPEDNFLNDIEIIGWMYQFYISSKKDEVFASKKTITKDTLPAVTQLFTPDWIVRYMAENSVGRIWLESYPNSPLRAEMKYYVDDPKQTAEVQRKIDAIKYRNVNPEDIRIIEPCCGSGHILVYVFDLLYRMYEEKGYQKREIPTLILSKNLVGLDVDKRAAQLASFSLAMKARSVNNRFFDKPYYTAPRVYEIIDSHRVEKLPYQQFLSDAHLLTDEEMADFKYLIETFRYGKTIGSLLKIKRLDFYHLLEQLDTIERTYIQDVFGADFRSIVLPTLKKLLTLAEVLSDKYDVMITNPPYMGSDRMPPELKSYLSAEYPQGRYDTYACFILKKNSFVKRQGYAALITMHNFMYAGSYESLREGLRSNTFINMLHLGARAFEAISGDVVQTTAFVISNVDIDEYSTPIIRVVDSATEQKPIDFFDKKNRYYYDLRKCNILPLGAMAYSMPQNLYELYKNNMRIAKVAFSKAGVVTGNDEYFLRLWFEPIFTDICRQRSFPYSKYHLFSKGGTFVRWYGNIWHVIKLQDLYNDSLTNVSVRRGDKDFYFKKAIGWSQMGGGNDKKFSQINNCVCGTATPTIYVKDENQYFYILAFLNTKICPLIIKMLNPTLSTYVSDISNLPLSFSSKWASEVVSLAQNNISISQSDWDSSEISWDFKRHPLVFDPMLKAEYKNSQWAEDRISKCSSLSWLYDKWEQECRHRFDQLKANEEELNRIFIDIYGLQDELTPEVEDKDVTVRLADKERDVKSLISYLIGVIMGRYSLDEDGLAYAGGAWDASKYRTYQPDDDGIVPIYDGVGMQDGLTAKICELLKVVYGEQYYKANIDFIADALGKSQNESSEETLNRYLNNGFYTDHLKTYQKRPIYWMLSSGKNSGFKCLVYMHRYNADTLARVNGKYFLPESTRLKNELDELQIRIRDAEGREKIRLEKTRQKVAASYNEAIEYGQALDHMANQYIAIDLDDGVKVNYAKFQGVEMVTDSGTKVKKDLLVPIK